MSASARRASTETLDLRVGALDWQGITAELEAQGVALIPALLTATECEQIAILYAEAVHFRSRVSMAHHNYGRGEYSYFNYPLPALVAELRTSLYPALVPLANRWSSALNSAVQYPEDLASFVDRCHRAGQVRPTPLLLTYDEGDYNCLHQDVYGEHVFPLQVAVLLSQPGRDFNGGEFVMTEQRPRMQSRPMVLPLQQGDAAVFAVAQRPVAGKRGPARVQLRHGVSRVRSGQRRTLGIIFHDAT